MSFTISAMLYTALLTLPYNNNNNNIRVLVEMFPNIYVIENYSNELNNDGFLPLNELIIDCENDIFYSILSTNKTDGSLESYTYSNTLNHVAINNAIKNGIDDGEISGFYLAYLENEGWLNLFLQDIYFSISPSYEIVPSYTENVGIYCVYDLNISFRIAIGNWSSSTISFTINELDSFEIDTLINFETYGAFNVNNIHSGIYYNNDTNFTDYLYNTTEIFYNDGYQDGEQDGYENGYQDGEQDGYAQGEQDGYNKKYDFLDIIKGGFDAVSNFFNMEIFPGVKFIYIIGIPLVIAVLRFVVGWFR